MTRRIIWGTFNIDFFVRLNIQSEVTILLIFHCFVILYIHRAHFFTHWTISYTKNLILIILSTFIFTLLNFYFWFRISSLLEYLLKTCSIKTGIYYLLSRKIPNEDEGEGLGCLKFRYHLVKKIINLFCLLIESTGKITALGKTWAFAYMCVIIHFKVGFDDLSIEQFVWCVRCLK